MIDLPDWLKARPVEFACVLAARVALRVVPVLERALQEDGEERRRDVVLPAFLALAASSFAGAWPGRAEEAGKIARDAGKRADEAIGVLAHDAQMSVFDAIEAIGYEERQTMWQYENEARALGIATHAVNAVAQAARAVVYMVNAKARKGDRDTVSEAVASSALGARSAVYGIHGNTEFEDPSEGEPDEGVPPHIESFHASVNLDVNWIESSVNAGNRTEETVAGLSKEALWLDGTPSWASERWESLKDSLPEREGWGFWTAWYEARLEGRELDDVLERQILTIPRDDWERGPAHVNGIIAKMDKARSDPILFAMEHMMEELDLGVQVSSIDLSDHCDRIKKALPDDPSQAIGATKEMLEATMRTILDLREGSKGEKMAFEQLIDLCLEWLKLKAKTAPASDVDRYHGKFVSQAKRMILAISDLRNVAGTGHGRVKDKEPHVTAADARLVASVGITLVAWLLHHYIEFRALD